MSLEDIILKVLKGDYNTTPTTFQTLYLDILEELKPEVRSEVPDKYTVVLLLNKLERENLVKIYDDGKISYDYLG